MFKFLIYLFLFYVVSRFVFGILLNPKVKSNSNINNDPEDNDIKVNQKANQNKPKGNSSNIGEYVDYEEIK